MSAISQLFVAAAAMRPQSVLRRATVILPALALSTTVLAAALSAQSAPASSKKTQTAAPADSIRPKRPAGALGPHSGDR
ncbi:hypothetical protein, partial [Gemmatimonas sp.]